MGTKVDTKHTPWTLDELFGALDRAFHAIVGVLASAEALATLAGQATIETGRGGKSCYGNNVSNIMGTSPEGLFHELAAAPECGDPNNLPPGARLAPNAVVVCGEGKVAYIPANPSRFRSYSSLDLGCEDKMSVLLALWPKAIEALLVSDGSDVKAVATAFALALKKPIAKNDYHSSDKTSYARFVTSLAAEFIERAQVFVDRRTILPPPNPTLLDNKPTESVVLPAFLETLVTDTPDKEPTS